MITPEFLGKLPLFSGLEAENLHFLASKLQKRRYRRGEVIFHEGDPGGQLYIIVSGRVRISVVAEDGRERDLALLDPGECFGEMSLLDGGERSATATAIVETEALVLSREAFYRFARGNAGVMESLVSLLIQRLRDTNRLLGEVLFLNLPARVARQLVRLAESSGQASLHDSPVVIPLDQEELARLVGASRESVNRALHLYQRQGLLTTSLRSVTVTDLRALREAASSPE